MCLWQRKQVLSYITLLNCCRGAVTPTTVSAEQQCAAGALLQPGCNIVAHEQTWQGLWLLTGSAAGASHEPTAVAAAGWMLHHCTQTGNIEVIPLISMIFEIQSYKYIVSCKATLRTLPNLVCIHLYVVMDFAKNVNVVFCLCHPMYLVCR